MSQQQKFKRRWFRFSLRTLLVLVTIAGVVFGWLGMKVRQAQRQRDLVKAIRESGGFVRYDYEQGTPNNQFVTPPVPIWLWELFGADFFANVATVILEGPDITDVTLEQLHEFTKLDSLGIVDCQVTDAGLVHLQKLPWLRAMVLDKGDVTDAGLRHLQGLTCLEFLILRQLPQTEEGFAHLQKLTNLKTLVIDACSDPSTMHGRDELQKSLPNLRIVED